MNRADSDKQAEPTPVSISILVGHAFREFIAIPVTILGGFLLLAALTLFLDSAGAAWLQTGRYYIGKYLFSSSQGTSNLLGTLLTGLLTVVSITFSVLLLAVQQTASTLTSQVYDQFLRRRINQIYFGYFVGLVVYTLLVLAAVAPNVNPVYSTTCVVLLTAFGLCLLILLIYSTIDQMRPSVIVRSIHDHTLKARRRERELLCRTRRRPRSSLPTQARVYSENDGFVGQVNLGPLAQAIQDAGGEVEIVIRVRVGNYVAFGDVLAEVRADKRDPAEALAASARQAVVVERDRDMDSAPAVGIVELETIGWTTTSSAKSTPEPARLVIDAVRDLLARWSKTESGDVGHAPPDQVLPIVYEDKVFAQALDVMATIAAGTGESMQHGVLAHVLRALALLFGHLPDNLREQTEDVVLRMIPSLGAVTLTRDLDAAIRKLIEVLELAGASQTASRLEAARRRQADSVGRLSG